MGERTKERPCKCPKCKGKGEYLFEYSETSPEGTVKKSQKSFCHTCNGEGWITEQKGCELAQEKLRLRREIALYWCNCGNPSEEVTFYDDGQHPHCEKHCYTCNDCGKLVQVG